ncbi:glycoside hydrolase family 127 protein, partial [Vibrio parahaemolyticus]|nr:glycoside hydrolase family 127 protein [Vibrio parahaemolyticus]
SRHLFRWTKEVSYADYYERALTNGVLSIQRGTDPGVMIYMLPLGLGVSKAKTYHSWGTPFDSFWCCYGT